eukprot:UN16294
MFLLFLILLFPDPRQMMSRQIQTQIIYFLPQKNRMSSAYGLTKNREINLII